MPKVPISEAANADLNGASAGFSDVSQIRDQREEADPVRNGIFIGLAVVLLVFLGSMIAVLMMHAPAL
jgi:pheromone shutdown protein TraB